MGFLVLGLRFKASTTFLRWMATNKDRKQDIEQVSRRFVARHFLNPPWWSFIRACQVIRIKKITRRKHYYPVNKLAMNMPRKKQQD